MKFTKIVGVATVVTLAIVTSNAKAIPATNTINQGHSANFHDNYLIQDRDRILQAPHLNIANLTFENNKKARCKIRKLSITENWINLLGSLIILASFASYGATNNSPAMERYVKFIFKDILPIFLIVFLSLSLLGIASVIASTSLSSSTPLATSSINSQKTCILK